VNPFRPTFGASPPVLAGRDELVDAFAMSLVEGPGSPGRATIYTGPRGSGKTVMLNRAEVTARKADWLVISENATAGLIDRLVTDHLPTLLADRVGRRGRKTRLKGVSMPAGMGSAAWDTTDKHSPVPSLRSQLTALTGLLKRDGAGLLITVDEIHAGVPAEVRELASVIQHLFRENREVAFAAAGLPAALEDRLLRDDVITFLRRADRYLLGAVDLEDVLDALRRPIETGRRLITPIALETAAAATAGYPFLVQLVGYQIWRQDPSSETITLEHVEAAMPAVRRRLGTLVHEPSLADVSEVDRTYLLAMAQDNGPSRTADIAKRMGVNVNYASQYRARLIAAELVVQPARGLVDFELPYLREYLREHGALDAQLHLPNPASRRSVVRRAPVHREI
jgi:hypothetical protein